MIFINRGVYGLGWVELRSFFNPTHRGGLKKKTQSNPTHHRGLTQPTWNGLDPWVGQLFLITTNIIIKLSIRTTLQQIRANL